MRTTNSLISAFALLASLVSASSVQDLTPKNFDSVVLKSGTPSLVEFFAPWCGHCKSLAPIYDELASGFKSKKVNIAKVDADEHKDLGSRFGITGFPTLKWFDGKSKDPQDYSGGRDLDSLAAFVTEKTGIKMAKKAAVPSNVEMLTDKTFAEKIGADQDVLVAFTAPWCGHCKSLAPTWETLAHDFALEKGVLIAKVDAEAPDSSKTSKDQGVTSYPTIKFFPKGKKEGVAYTGGRDEKSFIEYINTAAGTFRTVGGGLNAKAGVIESLDTIISTLTTSNLADITTQITKASEGLKDKYVEYYAKVLAKIAASQNYANKELSRLEGILKRGGLNQEKTDDLTSRINILRAFNLGGRDEL